MRHRLVLSDCFSIESNLGGMDEKSPVYKLIMDGKLDSCERGDGSSDDGTASMTEPSLISTMSSEDLDSKGSDVEDAYIRRDRISSPRNGRGRNRLSFTRKPWMLVAGIISISLITLILRRPWSIYYRRFPRLMARRPQILERIAAHSDHPQFSLVVQGSRLDAVYRAVQRYSHCDAIDSIRIDWEGPDDIPTMLLDLPNMSLTKIATDAVAIIDEQFEPSCQALNRGFYTWKQDPSRYVGNNRLAFVHRYYYLNRGRVDLQEVVNAVSGKPSVALAGTSRGPSHLSYQGR